MIVSIFFKRIFFCIYLPVVSYWRTITCLHWSVNIEKPYLYLKNYEMWRVKRIIKHGTFYERIKFITIVIILLQAIAIALTIIVDMKLPVGTLCLMIVVFSKILKYSENIWHLVLIGCNIVLAKKKMQQQLSNQSSWEWVLKINNEKYVYYKKLNSSFSKSNQAPSKKFQIPLA